MNINIGLLAKNAPWRPLLLLLAATLTMTSCSTVVKRGNNHLANLEYSKFGHPGASSTVDTTTAQQNMQEEIAVVEEIRKAWKLAAVEKDKEGAMKILKKLDEEHPGISTVQMMMGQVEEHFGDHEKAVVHFRQAHSVNEFSSVQTYKLAESLRKAGKPDESIVYYEKLEKRLETAVAEFKRDGMKELLGSVRIGLAEALFDSNAPVTKVNQVLAKLKDADAISKKRASRVLYRVVEKYPDNAEAKMLLKDYDL